MTISCSVTGLSRKKTQNFKFYTKYLVYISFWRRSKSAQALCRDFESPKTQSLTLLKISSER